MTKGMEIEIIETAENSNKNEEVNSKEYNARLGEIGNELKTNSKENLIKATELTEQLMTEEAPFESKYNGATLILEKNDCEAIGQTLDEIGIKKDSEHYRILMGVFESIANREEGLNAISLGYLFDMLQTVRTDITMRHKDDINFNIHNEKLYGKVPEDWEIKRDCVDLIRSIENEKGKIGMFEYTLVSAVIPIIVDKLFGKTYGNELRIIRDIGIAKNLGPQNMAPNQNEKNEELSVSIFNKIIK